MLKRKIHCWQLPFFLLVLFSVIALLLLFVQNKINWKMKNIKKNSFTTYFTLQMVRNATSLYFWVTNINLHEAKCERFYTVDQCAEVPYRWHTGRVWRAHFSTRHRHLYVNKLCPSPCHCVHILLWYRAYARLFKVYWCCSVNW